MQLKIKCGNEQFWWVALLIGSPALADWKTNMSPGVTAVSREIYDLHMIIFWICVVIAAVVFGVMFWSVFAHRKSKGAKPTEFHESTTIEIIWTAVPFVILIGMAVPATKALVSIYDTEGSIIDIKVTGYQWKWHYDYLNEGISFFSNLSTPLDQIYNREPKGENYLLEVDEPLVVPAHTKVRLLLTANDVIHSWWVPAIAVKKDAIPGFINEAWTIIDEPGIYRGQCAELCGKDHGFMPIVIVAKEQADYDDWLAKKQQLAAAESQLQGQEWNLAELLARGKGVYDRYCAACHQASGEGLPPQFPGLKDSPIVKNDIAEHINVVVNGRAGTYMAAFGAQLNNADLAAVVTYERNAWGRDSGELVQPADLAKIKAVP